MCVWGGFFCCVWFFFFYLCNTKQAWLRSPQQDLEGAELFSTVVSSQPHSSAYLNSMMKFQKPGFNENT